MMFSDLAVIQNCFLHCVLMTYAMLPAYRKNICDPLLMALFGSLVSDLLVNDLSLVDVKVKEANRCWV